MDKSQTCVSWALTSRHLLVSLPKWKASLSFTRGNCFCSSGSLSLCPSLHHPFLLHQVWNVTFIFYFALLSISACIMFSSHIPSSTPSLIHSFVHKHFWAPARFWILCLVPETVSWTSDFSWACCVTTKARRVPWEGRRDAPTSSGRLVRASWRSWCLRAGGCVGTGQERGQGTVIQNSLLQHAKKFRGQRKREGGAWWDWQFEQMGVLEEWNSTAMKQVREMICAAVGIWARGDGRQWMRVL